MTVLGAFGGSAAMEIVTNPSTANVARSIDLVNVATLHAFAAMAECGWLLLITGTDDSLRKVMA
jgi:hypothetical protein